MNTDHLEALLWARVDGTIEPGELAELEAYLAEHPEPRDIERQIWVMADELGKREKMQPPPELRERIDRALEHATPPIPHQAVSLLARPIPSWQARWLPAVASLVIGVAIGYLVHPGTGSSIDRAGVTGTMHVPPEAVVMAPVEIGLEDGAGRVTASRSGTDVVVDVTLATDIEFDVTITGSGGPVQFANMSSVTGSTTEVVAENGWILVRSKGPGAVTFSVRAFDAGDPLRLQVSSAGTPLHEAWIGPSRTGHEP